MAADRSSLAARARASTAGTGSTAARPTSSCPRCSATTTRCSRRARPPRATTSPRTSPTRRSSISATCATSSRDAPFFLYFATGACHSPHHAPPEWIERYRGRFDDGLGRVARARRSPVSVELGVVPRRAPSSRRVRRGCRPGTSSTPEDQQVAARFMECFAGVPLPHRRADRARARVPRASSARPTTRRRARVRQRRARRGRRRSARSTTPACGTACPAGRARAARPHRRARRSDRRTTTTRGAGRWPATRRSGAGSARCTRAASPIPASCAGRRGIAGDAASSAASSRTPSTCCRPCSS